MPVTPPVGKFGSALSLFLVSGYSMLAAKLQGLRYKIEAINEPTHGMGDAWEESSPVGVSKAEVAQEGAYFFTESGNIHDALVTQSGGGPGAIVPTSTPRVVVLGLAGNTIGQPFIGFEGVFNASYEVLATVGKLQRANAMYQVTGKAEHGVILHALATEVTDPATTEPASSVDHTTEAGILTIPIATSVAAGDLINTSAPHKLAAGDTALIAGHAGATPALNGIVTVLAVISPTQFSITTDITVGGSGGTLVQAKSNNGGFGYLEVEALTLGGFTSATVTLRHSDDNSTYVDLLVMTTVTVARASERKSVAGAVRRYLAQNVDFIGAGAAESIRYFAGFARG